ncbi:MAG: zinc-ribbon domain-containing protein [Proteobacteria bacterium]|nr:zinc-ribbon domain-containing protein [Pseudomonadota bacterium]
MYTQCPQCLTVYEIDEDVLQASLGIVRCGKCRERFDALRTLSDTLPAAPLTPLSEQDPELHTPTLTIAVAPANYELEARRRHPPRPAGSGLQRQLDLSSAPPQDAASDAASGLERTADDWFAQLESELAAAPGTAAKPLPPATGGPATGTASGDPDSDRWPLEDVGMRADGDGGTRQESATPTGAEVPSADAAIAPMDVAALDSGAPPQRAPAQAAVVSPRLLAGEVFVEGIAGHDQRDIPMGEPVAENLADVATPDAVGAGIAVAGSAPGEPELATQADASPSEQATPADVLDATATPAPVYVRPRRRFLSAGGLAWSAGCLVLALLLAAQLAWANRVELVRNRSTRAWTQHLCTLITCRLPPIKDVAQLQLLSRDVRPDPNTAGALTVTATVRNDAGFRQPWPVVTVELTDFDNHAVAMRRFRPAEYMPDPARRAAGIAPGATAALAFEVADPGKRAGGYRFSFE